jgi:hypothetical protein
MIKLAGVSGICGFSQLNLGPKRWPQGLVASAYWTETSLSSIEIWNYRPAAGFFAIDILSLKIWLNLFRSLKRSTDKSLSEINSFCRKYRNPTASTAYCLLYALSCTFPTLRRKTPICQVSLFVRVRLFISSSACSVPAEFQRYWAFCVLISKKE